MDQNEKLREQLTQAKKDGHFIFVPSTPLPKINGIFIPVLDVIRLIPSDFYPNQGKFGMHHHGAMKLAEAAGVQWAAESGRVGRMDNRDNPNYCSFRVVGRIRTQEGLWAETAGHKHIDLDAKRGAMEAKYAEDFEYKLKYGGGKGPNGWDVKKPWPTKKDEYIARFTDRDINQIKESIDERCESGAQSRVIRNILHIPVSFSADNSNKNSHAGITKDWYIVRYVLDASNQLVQQAQIASFQQAILGIYGPGMGMIQAPQIKTLPEAKEIPNSDGDDDDPPIDHAESSLIDFENQDAEDQEKTILGLIKQVQYKFYDQDMKGNPPLHMWSQSNRTDYFKHILKTKENK